MNAAGLNAVVIQGPHRRLARAYAEALAELLPADDQALQASRELAAAAEALHAVEGFPQLVTQGWMDARQREQLAAKAFGETLSRPVSALLGVMARNDRLALVPAAAEELRAVLDSRWGLAEVRVTSAVPLAAELKQKIGRALSQALGSPVSLRAEIDDDLVGGLRVQVGDRVYDASVHAKLDRLHQNLMNRLGRLTEP